MRERTAVKRRGSLTDISHMREAIAPARQSVRPHAIVLSLVSDERLAKLAAGGDTVAFGTIYQRYHAPLYRYCRSIVGSPDDASDALQNTMLAAFRSLQGEIRSIRLKPWLYKIAHNESVSLLRSRRPTVDLEAAGQMAGSDMAVDATTRERLRQLMTDVAKLSEQQRGALLMRELNGLEYQEIGAALGTSESAAKQSVHEARVALTDAESGRDMACAVDPGHRLRARRSPAARPPRTGPPGRLPVLLDLPRIDRDAPPRPCCLRPGHSRRSRDRGAQGRLRRSGRRGGRRDRRRAHRWRRDRCRSRREGRRHRRRGRDDGGRHLRLRREAGGARQGERGGLARRRGSR